MPATLRKWRYDGYINDSDTLRYGDFSTYWIKQAMYQTQKSCYEYEKCANIASYTQMRHIDSDSSYRTT